MKIVQKQFYDKKYKEILIQTGVKLNVKIIFLKTEVFDTLYTIFLKVKNVET